MAKHRTTLVHIVIAIFTIGIFLYSIESTSASPSDSIVIRGLRSPWAVVTSPDGNIWITEKAGKIKVYGANYRLKRELTGFPDLAVYGEGGLLDLAFHPDFKRNGLFYVAYSVAERDAGGGVVGYYTRINRLRHQGGRLVDHRIIFNGPSTNFGTHFGARIIFDSKGYLFASFGDRQVMALAQDMNVMNGKIVRLNDDGTIPQDNPFRVGGAVSPIYSYGHRNPQGLEFDPRNGRLFNSEHGPSGWDFEGGGDEINEVIARGNYGWPNFHHNMSGNGVIAPIASDIAGLTEAVAPSGIAFYTGSKIPDWKNDLFVACLRGQGLIRIRIGADGKIIKQVNGEGESVDHTILLKDKYGRLRDVVTSPNGTLLALAQSGKLIELK